MVVTSDIGNIDDIHPKNKKDVGERLGNVALQKHYKVYEKLVESPLFEKLEIKGNKVTVFFTYSDGLYFKDTSKDLFEIAGDDKIFYPAKAKIKGETVFTSSKNVKNPKYVRFAWTNIGISNLFNAANLPASSFTTVP
jgi:sialate O-acetylesterase